MSSGYTGGIGVGLLASAGPDAKDGAHALKVGYGTMFPQDHISKSTNAQQYKDLPQVSIPESVHEEHEDQTHTESTRQGNGRANTSNSAQSSDSTIEKSKRHSPYSHRGQTRSGSITEQIVDVNGIRKVVLHAAPSSSSEGELQTHEGSHSPSQSRYKDAPVIESDGSKSGNTAKGSQKKKRRKKKRDDHHAKQQLDSGPGEDQPLLRQDS